MHHSEDFLVTDITKIEGHATLSLKLREKKVESCEFRVTESHRFFEDMVRGRHFSQVPLIVSRICGLCSSSHLTTAIEALEHALDVEPSEQTLLLRQLSIFGEFIKSHALHLYMLALPDYLGKESVLQFSEKEHHLIHEALDLKKAGTDILAALGGRAHHTVNSRVGGFTKLPSKEKLDSCLKNLESARAIAFDAVQLFDSFASKYSFGRKTNFVALKGSSYPFLNGHTIHSADGTSIPKEELMQHLKEFVIPYSTAKHAEFNGRDYVVGSNARIALNRQQLHPSAKKAMAECKTKLPNKSPFSNNLCQVIELVHCIESAIDSLKDFSPRNEPLQEIKPKQCSGVGVTEAPRGLLYHTYSLDSNGFVTESNKIIPTQQNIKSIELDLHKFVPTILSKPREQAELEMEKLIRAYDPCISCSTHFLKVKWA